MDLERLQQVLLDTARQAVPSDHVPYAFEQRVMARLRSAKADPLAIWGSWLWRSALSACALAVVAGGVTLFQPGPSMDESESSLELADTHLEQVLYASASGNTESW